MPENKRQRLWSDVDPLIDEDSPEAEGTAGVVIAENVLAALIRLQSVLLELLLHNHPKENLFNQPYLQALQALVGSTRSLVESHKELVHSTVLETRLRSLDGEQTSGSPQHSPPPSPQL